jgi:hypothetical protein
MTKLPREAVVLALLHGYAGVVAAVERAKDRDQPDLDTEELHLATRTRDLLQALLTHHAEALSERRAEITAGSVKAN